MRIMIGGIKVGARILDDSSCHMLICNLITRQNQISSVSFPFHRCPCTVEAARIRTSALGIRCHC